MNYPENQHNMRDKLPYPPYSLHLTYSLKCLQVREIAEKNTRSSNTGGIIDVSRESCYD